MDYVKQYPWIPVGSNFFGTNRMDKSPRNCFLSESMWVRPCTESDYTKGSAMLNRIQTSYIGDQPVEKDWLTILSVAIVKGNEPDIANTMYVLSKKYPDTFMLNVSKTIAKTIIGCTLPSTKQTALLASLLSQYSRSRMYMCSGNMEEGIRHMRSNLYGVALAVARWPKNRQNLSDQLELVLTELPKCPFREPGITYFDLWFQAKKEIPTSIQKPCIEHADIVSKTIDKYIPLDKTGGILTWRSETGFNTVTNMKRTLKTVNGNTCAHRSKKHMEALRNEYSKIRTTPLYVKATLKPFVRNVFDNSAHGGGSYKRSESVDGKVIVRDGVSFKDAFKGFVYFFSLYKACVMHGNIVSEDDMVQYSSTCEKLWKLVRYFLAVAVNSSRSSDVSVHANDGKSDSHPLSYAVRCWIDGGIESKYPDINYINRHDIETVVMARLSKVTRTLLSTLTKSSHPFFKHPTSLVWAAMIVMCDSDNDTMHVSILCEMWMNGLIDECELWGAFINTCRFITEKEWHTGNDTMKGGHSDVYTVPTEKSDCGNVCVSHEGKVDACDGICDEEIHTFHTDGYAQTASTAVVHGSSVCIQPSFNSHPACNFLDMKRIIRINPLQSMCESALKKDMGYLDGYVDRVAVWASTPSTPPEMLVNKHFSGAMRDVFEMNSHGELLVDKSDVADLDCPYFIKTLFGSTWKNETPCFGPALFYAPLSHTEMSEVTSIMEKQIQAGLYMNAYIIMTSLSLHRKTFIDATLDDAMILAAVSYTNIGINIGSMFGISWSHEELVWHDVMQSTACVPGHDSMFALGELGTLLSDSSSTDEIDKYTRRLADEWRMRNKKPEPPISYHLPDTIIGEVDPFASDDECIETNMAKNKEFKDLIEDFKPSPGVYEQKRYTLAIQKRMGLLTDQTCEDDGVDAYKKKCISNSNIIAPGDSTELTCGEDYVQCCVGYDHKDICGDDNGVYKDGAEECKIATCHSSIDKSISEIGSTLNETIDDTTKRETISAHTCIRNQAYVTSKHRRHAHKKSSITHSKKKPRPSVFDFDLDNRDNVTSLANVNELIHTELSEPSTKKRKCDEPVEVSYETSIRCLTESESSNRDANIILLSQMVYETPVKNNTLIVKNIAEWKTVCTRPMNISTTNNTSEFVRKIQQIVSVFDTNSCMGEIPVVLGSQRNRSTVIYSEPLSQWLWVQCFRVRDGNECPTLILWCKCATQIWQQNVSVEESSASTRDTMTRMTPCVCIEPKLARSDYVTYLAVLPLTTTPIRRSVHLKNYEFSKYKPHDVTGKLTNAIMMFHDHTSVVRSASDYSDNVFRSLMFWIVFPRAFGYVVSSRCMGINSKKRENMTLVPVTWELGTFDYESFDKEEGADLDLGTFLMGPCYTKDEFVRTTFNDLFGVGFKGRCMTAKLNSIQNIFAEAREAASSLGMAIDERAYAMLAALC